MTTKTFKIGGMHCAACSSGIEKFMGRQEGVESVSVNLTTEKMTIRYDETKVTPEQIVAKVEKAGFGCTPHAEKKEAAEQALQDAEAAELRHRHVKAIQYGWRELFSDESALAYKAELNGHGFTIAMNVSEAPRTIELPEGAGNTSIELEAMSAKILEY